MGMIQRIVKPSTHRTKRLLKSKEPKIIENVKQTLFIRGRKAHSDVLNCMKQIALLKKPHALTLTKKHDVLPFEDFDPVEKLCRKYDASMFLFASHSKKRPNNLIIGRTFDHQKLDVFELGVDSFVNLTDISDFTPSVGIKPALVFVGEEFETDQVLKRLKSILIDLLHQKESDVVHLNVIEYVISFVYVENKILMRTHRIAMKSVGEKAPRIDLSHMGPSADLSLRRHTLASTDLFKKAMKKPKIAGKKIKNIRRDAFGSKLGRVHMTSQNVNKLQTRKMKGLKRSAKEKKAQKSHQKT